MTRRICSLCPHCNSATSIQVWIHIYTSGTHAQDQTLHVSSVLWEGIYWLCWPICWPCGPLSTARQQAAAVTSVVEEPQFLWGLIRLISLIRLIQDLSPTGADYTRMTSASRGCHQEPWSYSRTHSRFLNRSSLFATLLNPVMTRMGINGVRSTLWTRPDSIYIKVIGFVTLCTNKQKQTIKNI